VLFLVVQTVKRKFWMQKLTNTKSEAGNFTNCYYGHRKYYGTINYNTEFLFCVQRETDIVAESCKEEMNFVCSLPAMCHEDACQMKCAGSNSIYCRASFPKQNCFPQCTPVDCSESVCKNNIFCFFSLLLLFFN
jgi:hypothetical protein